MADAQSQMLDLAVRLAEKEASGALLTPAEGVISDITWLDTQVSANGFYGWLLNTSSDRVQRTMEALTQVDCASVKTLAAQALRIARVEPAMSEDAKSRQLDRITEKQLEWLLGLDGPYYEAVEHCMAQCQAFAEREGIL